MLKGNMLIGQSGGPTSVINASVAGAVIEALKHSDVIGTVYGMQNGIKGVLTENLFNLNLEDPKELELLKTTPSSALGSVRYKLTEEKDFEKILEVFKKYDIRYFFYAGGNDSMDTCNKISKFVLERGHECKVIGIPKTIDNDLWGTDHCPGYASAAKYVATSTSEIYQDARVYDKGMIIVMEIMGRNAGWLTAASALANKTGSGPDLVYLPEVDFDLDDFVKKASDIYEKTGNCMIAVSEGIKDKDGKYIAEYGSDLASSKDAFGHSQMGGLAPFLANTLKARTGAKVRAIEFSLLQRCAAHMASKTDVTESANAGKEAVLAALNGITDKMVCFSRPESGAYECKYGLLDLADVANKEKKVPLDWYDAENATMKEAFFDYALPLLEGESAPPFENGLPRFAHLKKQIEKK